MRIPFLSNVHKASPPETPKDKGVSPAMQFAQGITTIQDILAPDAIEVDFTHLKIGNRLVRTLFVAGYPRFVAANWLSPLINFDHSLDVSMFVYPVEGKGVLENLRRKITEMEAEINSDLQRGRLANIDTQVKLEDAKGLQEQLAKGSERFYQFGLYVTIGSDTEEELNQISKQIQSTLGALLIIAKPASFVMEQAFKTTQPLGQDFLNITRNMDTTSLATTFPFTSSELSANEGIMYGINEHNDSLVVFDRFSRENANMVVFAKSGAGKSYFVKLEALRSLMFDTEVIVIDPEDEYHRMADAVNGQYIDFSFSSTVKINPFDLPSYARGESGQAGENELSQKLLSLHALMKIMLGDMNATQEAVLDRALIAAYKAKGISPNPESFNNEPPLLEDLYKALIGMEAPQAEDLAARLEKYVKGSFRGLVDQKTNVNLTADFIVFGIKNLEDELRPVAMFMILDFIWTKVKSQLKRRLLIVDEAWYLMKNQDSALFLYSMAKRARKYYLGLTTITQDVEDFLHSDYGKAIVTNSSIQVLMKQSAAAVDSLQEAFYLSAGEKQLLMASEIGEGLFFAGQNHVAIKVIASPEEHRLITSKPQELLEMQGESSRPEEGASPAVATPRRVDVNHGSGEHAAGASPEEHKLITSKPQEILEMIRQQESIGGSTSPVVATARRVDVGHGSGENTTGETKTGEQKIAPENNYWKPQKPAGPEPLALNEIEVDVAKATVKPGSQGGGQIDKQINGQIDKQVNGQIDKPTVGPSASPIIRSSDGPDIPKPQPGAAVQPSIEFTSIFETKPKKEESGQNGQNG